MTPALDARGLGKRFRRDWGLRDCTLTIPEGAIVGLAGPNAAGKSTLLALAAGLLAPTEGSIAVLGRDPLREPSVLAEVGFVPQGAPLYRSLHGRRGDRVRAPDEPALGRRDRRRPAHAPRLADEGRRALRRRAYAARPRARAR